MLILVAAALGWGFAEATLFFIVPDVLLSAVALFDRRRALVLCLWTLAGALAGGALMYGWGRSDAEAMAEVLVQVPAVSAGMVAAVAHSLEQTGVAATFIGPLVGTPYKIYAAMAPGADIGLAVFLMVSVPARLLRFVMVVLVTAWIAGQLPGTWNRRRRLGLLLAFWTLFYAAYLTVMPW